MNKPEQNSSLAAQLRVHFKAPWHPGLSGLMDEAPALMDALASEFAPFAERLATQQAYWIAINGWITDRLSGPILNGKVGVEALSQQAWAAYATAYWGGMELRENWGMPPAMARLGIQMSPPFTEPLLGVAAYMTPRLDALKGSDDDCIQYAATLLHDGSGPGALWSTAYNAGCQIVKTEDPPVGQRDPRRPFHPAAVRINDRDFLRVDYDMATPQYLKVWRSAYERAVKANPQAYEALIVGESGQENLREIWKRGVNFGNTSWGDGANDAWTDAYFEDTLQWSTVVNFGLEAVSLAAFVAVLEHDATAARRAIMGNALYVGMGTGWLLGFLDTEGNLPRIEKA